MASHRATGDYMRPAFGLLLEKLAYGPDDVTSVLEATRPYIHSRGRLTPATLPAVRLPMADELRSSRRAASVAQALSPETPLPQAHLMREALVRAGRMPRRSDLSVPSPRVEIPMSRGKEFRDARELAAKVHPDTPLDYDNRRALASITRGTSVDDLHAALHDPSFVASGAGLHSIKSLLKEHNKVTTLPQELQAAREVMQASRAGSMADQLRQHTGIEYGVSPRLNRHKIRQLADALERRGVRMT